VLSLILVLLLVWFIATVVLAAWTLWFQAYIYSEPVTDVWWRAPAAGTALAIFFVIWMVCDYRAPGRYRELQEFSTTEYITFPELRVIPREPNKPPEVYKQHKSGRGSVEYLRGGTLGDRQLPSRPYKILAILDGKEYLFEPVQSEGKGGIQVSTDTWRYRNAETGWEMTEGQLGQVSISHRSWLIGNLLLNFLHGVVWFLCLWLLMRFQWSHALGLAVVFWLVTTLFVLPKLLDHTERVSRQRNPPPASAPAAPAA
jgi:hypothetical protein